MAGKNIFISFVQPVDSVTVNSILKICNEAVRLGHETITLLISSQGGGMEVGFALYNQLIGLPVELTTYNIGSINSVANIIFLAGKKRLATPSATFLFHETYWNLPGATQLRFQQVNEISESLKAEDDRVKNVILSHSKMEREYLNKLIGKGSTLDANEALKNGIVHEIRELDISKGIEILQV